MVKAALLSLAFICSSACVAAPKDWSAVAASVSPAAVDIDVYQHKVRPARMWEISGVSHTWVTDLFDKLHTWQAGAAAGEDWSEGAGYIYNSRGMILTAAHVVENADEIWITLADHRRLAAHLVGYDLASDVAVLEINGHGPFPALSPADMKQIRVGQPVMAIGAPLGMFHSVTTGVVSAKREDNYFARATFIQTDTPATHGSSGGVVVDAAGRAVGMVSYGKTDAPITFLVPIDRALQVAAYLEKGERLPRPCTTIFSPGT